MCGHWGRGVRGGGVRGSEWTGRKLFAGERFKREEGAWGCLQGNAWG